jgi:hypothetical protein
MLFRQSSISLSSLSFSTENYSVYTFFSDILFCLIGFNSFFNVSFTFFTLFNSSFFFITHQFFFLFSVASFLIWTSFWRFYFLKNINYWVLFCLYFWKFSWSTLSNRCSSIFCILKFLISLPNDLIMLFCWFNFCSSIFCYFARFLNYLSSIYKLSIFWAYLDALKELIYARCCLINKLFSFYNYVIFWWYSSFIYSINLYSRSIC